MTEITCVLNADNYLGETPIWSVADQALWWVNCEDAAELHRFIPATGEHAKWPMPSRVGGMVPKAGGGLLVVLSHGLYDFDWETARLSPRVLSTLGEEVKLHECSCDRQGRLWVGSYDHKFPAYRGGGDGFYFRLDGDVLTPVIDGIRVANGLAVSPDGRTLYAADTPDRRVDAFDLDTATGALSNRRPFARIGPEGFLDGATVDAEGGYWLAVVGDAALLRFRADGTLDRKVDLPFSNPTRPAFGGADLDILYVTSTRMRINPDAPGFAANGGLFAFKPGERGVPDMPFAG